jgi:elongation factor Ts
MAEISAQMVKELRERTGAGMLDCKKALAECEGDAEKAIEYLRKKGLAAAAKKAGRIAALGSVVSYVHAGGRIGVLVEVNCETDFVGKTEDFQTFAHDVALQIAAMNPQFVSSEEIGAELLAKERAIRGEQVRQSGKPEKMVDKIVEGQIAKWQKEVCLLEQVFVKDTEGKKDIKTLLAELVGKLGENVRIRRFARFELGEGLEKRRDDFASEVATQAGQA